MMQLKMNLEAIKALMQSAFPQAAQHIEMVDIAPMTAVLRMPVSDKHLRPGGTVSGPTMFLLADCAYYIATLAMIGPHPLTVTTNANINFMRRPVGAALIGTARILKLGKQLSVGEVLIHTEENPDDCVAHATMTYSIPPEAAR